MSKGVMPVAMREKAEKVKKSCDILRSSHPWNSTCTLVLHLKNKQWSQMVNFSWKLDVCVATHTAYGLKCKQISLLPQLPHENG